MTRILRTLAALLCSAVLLGTAEASAASVQLQWDANTDPGVTGYLVLYGTRSGVYDKRVDVGNTTTATITIPTSGTYFFVVAAYSAGGTSDPSNEVSQAITGTSPFMAIDTPAQNQVMTSAFEVGGWALDAGAPTGAGVD